MIMLYGEKRFVENIIETHVVRFSLNLIIFLRLFFVMQRWTCIEIYPSCPIHAVKS